MNRSSATALRPYIAGAALFAVAMGIGRFAYTPLLVVMRVDAGLTVPMAGALASINLAGYLAGSLIAMLPAMKTHRMAIVPAAAIGVAVLTAAMAGPAWTWPLARALTGVGSGFVFVLTVGILLDHAQATGSRWGVAVFFSGVGTGIAAAGLLVPAFASAGGSRAAWLGLGALSAVVVAAAWRSLPNTAAPAARDASTGAAGDRAAFWRLAVLYGVEGAVYIIPATFLVAMAGEVPRLAPFAASAWVVVGVITAPSIALWSALALRIGTEAALVCASAAQAIALVAAAVAGGAAGVLVPALGLGLTAMGITALGTSLGHAYWPARSNTAVGVLTVLYGTGQIVGPLVATHVALATGSYRASLPLAGAALLAPTLVFALDVPRRRRRRARETPFPA